MKIFHIFLLFLLPILAFAQQVPDSSFTYPIENPRFAEGTGPIICIDAAHNNFHTMEGRYYAFAKLLQADGYLVQSFTKSFSEASLRRCFILVISNPLNEQNNNGNWVLPNPSAFTDAEIQAVEKWVAAGGRLLLIADHMPFAGAAEKLGKAFGFEFLNSFAMDNRRRSEEYFYKSNKTLREHPVTAGLDSVVTFTGSAFKIPRKAKPILQLDKNYTILMPEAAWVFQDNTPYISGRKLYQMASLKYGEGSVIVSGEAAMFSAQLAGSNRLAMGMNAPYAKNNPQLLLNVIRWLSE